MPKERLTAFSDGVIAIIITIMVLELKASPRGDPAALRSLLPALASYVMSFIYVGIYWNNHHHIFQAADRVSGMTLWANLHLLFWLSLVPFVTRWVGESEFAKWPVAAYGVVLILSALAWDIERRVLIRLHDPGSDFAQAFRGGLRKRFRWFCMPWALPPRSSTLGLLAGSMLSSRSSGSCPTDALRPRSVASGERDGVTVFSAGHEKNWSRV